MHMRVSGITILAAALLSGCTGGVQQELEQTKSQLEALNQRLAALELKTANAEREKLEMPVIEAPTAVATTKADTNVNVTVTPEVAAALADQINALVMSRVEATVDKRIASQVGTADDIEAIFSDVVEDEFDAREQAEIREEQERRSKQAAEWDVRGITRRASSAELDETQQTALLSAREEMRTRVFEQLPDMKENGATAAEMMAVVATSRERYESELLEIMDEEEVQAYYEADHMVQRDQRRLNELSESLELEDTQWEQVASAFENRRNTMSDGFMLMSSGYIGRGDIHEGMQQTQSAMNDAMKTALTPEQYTTYEESGAGSMHWGRRRR